MTSIGVSGVRAVVAAALLVLVVSVRGGAQTETVLYSFQGGSDGAGPYGLLYAGGSLYGAAASGGIPSKGTVYELSSNAQGWTEHQLYEFKGGEDGWNPAGPLFMDEGGNLYGTTTAGGAGGTKCFGGCGTVFELSPTSTGWKHTVLYSFQGAPDVQSPNPGLAMDKAGNLIGSALRGGTVRCPSGCGVVWELSPQANGSWKETLPYSFDGIIGGQPDNAIPDSQGNIYGTASVGGARGCGTIFKLTPVASGWQYTNLYQFTDGEDGCTPEYGLVMDSSGNLYGSTNSGSVIYEFSPASSGFTPLYRLTERVGALLQSIALAPDGSLYGTSEIGGRTGCCVGLLYGISPGTEGWQQTLTYFFNSNTGDYPEGPVVFDSAGNIYGTASGGGEYGMGVVYMITP
jgi:uncharacterized repeat protein (TIGR03803 family)